MMRYNSLKCSYQERVKVLKKRFAASGKGVDATSGCPIARSNFVRWFMRWFINQVVQRFVFPNYCLLLIHTQYIGLYIPKYMYACLQITMIREYLEQHEALDYLIADASYYEPSPDKLYVLQS